jgi:hypothetical protein
LPVVAAFMVEEGFCGGHRWLEVVLKLRGRER